jgi:hypothetical protein
VTSDVVDGSRRNDATPSRVAIGTVLLLGVLSVVLWAASYSWLVGLTPPTEWISRTASPWLVAEVAAVVVGVPAVVGGLVLAGRRGNGGRRTAVWAVALAGFATTASAVSLAL